MNTFDWFNNKLDRVDERISDGECIKIESTKTKRQKKIKTLNNRTEYSRTMNIYQRCKLCIVNKPEEEKENKGEEIFETIVIKYFPILISDI